MFKISGQLSLASAEQIIIDSQRGRLLYRLQYESTYYWLKLQQRAVSLLSERAFFNEIECYKQLSDQAKETFGVVCLPYQILDLSKFNDAPHTVFAQALCVLDSQALFDLSPELGKDVVIHRLIQSLNVLARLHQAGYIHGDLKTAHFRRDQQHCYLIDFEQSEQIEATQSVNQTATPRYMAPELFHAEEKTVQSDLYALGAIWLQWLNQTRWAKRSYLEWAYWHCQSLQVELPKSFVRLQPILQRMLAKNRTQRYRDIAEIKLDLLKIV